MTVTDLTHLSQGDRVVLTYDPRYVDHPTTVDAEVLLVAIPDDSGVYVDVSDGETAWSLLQHEVDRHLVTVEREAGQ